MDSPLAAVSDIMIILLKSTEKGFVRAENKIMINLKNKKSFLKQNHRMFKVRVI